MRRPGYAVSCGSLKTKSKYWGNKMEIKTITSGTAEISYSLSGSDSTVLLIQGTGLDGTAWIRQGVGGGWATNIIGKN